MLEPRGWCAYARQGVGRSVARVLVRVGVGGGHPGLQVVDDAHEAFSAPQQLYGFFALLLPSRAKEGKLEAHECRAGVHLQHIITVLSTGQRAEGS
jgi:hypothetical protein